MKAQGCARNERCPGFATPKVTALKGRKPPALHILGSLQKQKTQSQKDGAHAAPFCF